MINPSNKAERIDGIDIVRGFALLGIFIVNMPAFFLPILYVDQQEVAKTIVDKFIIICIDLFAQANFYTLFSFLFGFGTIFFYERLRAKEISPLPYLLRRFSLLLVLGIIHAFFIWHGDILITYAIVSFIFLLFIKKKPKSLLKIGIGFIVIPYIAISMLLANANNNTSTNTGNNYKTTLIEQSVATYQTGSYSDITEQRVNDWFYVHGNLGIVFVVIKLLPMFLLGAYFAKAQLFHQPQRYLKQLKRIAFFTLIFGFTLKFMPYISSNIYLTKMQDWIGGPLVAIGYATAIILLVEAKKFLKFLAPLRYVGRMSLSNYIFQSIVCTLIFYSYGLGLYYQVSHTVGLLLVFIIFSGQIILSKWWLERYQYGPLEWVWRAFTYKNLLTLKKAKMKQEKELI